MRARVSEDYREGFGGLSFALTDGDLLLEASGIGICTGLSNTP